MGVLTNLIRRIGEPQAKSKGQRGHGDPWRMVGSCVNLAGLDLRLHQLGGLPEKVFSSTKKGTTCRVRSLRIWDWHGSLDGTDRHMQESVIDATGFLFSLVSHWVSTVQIPRRIKLGAEDCPSIRLVINHHQSENTSWLNAQCEIPCGNRGWEVPELSR